jgi:hypothetical protein
MALPMRSASDLLCFTYLEIDTSKKNSVEIQPITYLKIVDTKPDVCELHAAHGKRVAKPEGKNES